MGVIATPDHSCFMPPPTPVTPFTGDETGLGGNHLPGIALRMDLESRSLWTRSVRAKEMSASCGPGLFSARR